MSTTTPIKRRALILGNWKMNGTLESNLALLSALEQGVSQASFRGEVDLGVAPPMLYVSQARSYLGEGAIAVGAQDVSAHDKGAYTGEVSAPMLRDMQCEFVLVGHSERRQYHAESAQLVASKALAAHKQDIVPIVCVGETIAQREAGQASQVITQMLEPVLALGASVVEQIVVAYEPVWAIGTGHTATPEQAQEMHALIRKLLRGVIGDKADQTRLLYGGSVKAANALSLFSQPDIDGGLIGGAALDAQEFLAILAAGAQAKA